MLIVLRSPKRRVSKYYNCENRSYFCNSSTLKVMAFQVLFGEKPIAIVFFNNCHKLVRTRLVIMGSLVVVIGSTKCWDHGLQILLFTLDLG